MMYKTSLAVLLLTASLIAAHGLSGVAFANDGGEKGVPARSCDCNKAGHKCNCDKCECNKGDPARKCECDKCKCNHLSKDKLNLLSSTMKKLRENNKTVFEDLRKLHEEQDDILAAKTFDKEAYLSVASKIEEKMGQLAESRNQAFASIADKFTPTERERARHMFKHDDFHHAMHEGAWKRGEEHKAWHRDGDLEGSRNGEEQKDGLKNQAQPAPAEPSPTPEQ